MSAETATDVQDVALCSNSEHRFRCHARVQVEASNGAAPRFKSHAAAPLANSFGALDLQAAYKIDPTKLATATVPTIAIVDAFGYTNLEADLAVYRSQYGLPPCTTANGCLKIVNQNGQTTPLPAQGANTSDAGWTVETALDVDMASAACPKCKILVVQATDPSNNLFIAENTAASLGATVISDSWGGPEQPGMTATDLATEEMVFNHTGIAIFVSSGDAGYNDTIADPTVIQQVGTGPDYPATSQYTIAVGATRLVKDATTTRGWKESLWATTTGQPAAGAGGSACSLYTPKPAYQTDSPCTKKATADISSVGDPGTGVAVYNTVLANGWTSVGGTSASAPFVAAIFAATGNGAQTSGQFIANNVAKLWDVAPLAGLATTNGTCTGLTKLCTLGAGWDGPTGFGSPNVSLLMPATATGGDGTGSGTGMGSGTGAGNGTGNGTGGGNGTGNQGTDDGSSNNSSTPQEVTGGCSATGSGAGLVLGLAFVGLGLGRRRRR